MQLKYRHLIRVFHQSKCAAFFLVFAICAFPMAAAGMPVWVTTPYKVYPSEKYFAQCGSGTSAKKAELDAVEKLAAIFSTSISSKSFSSSRMKLAQKEGEVSTAKVFDFSQDVTRKVSLEDLIGIELKESYTDGKTFYALAVMDKVDTAKALVSAVQFNDKKIQALLKDENLGNISIINYGRLNFAKEIALLNEKYLARLDVVDSSASANLKRSIVNSASLHAELAKMASFIPIYIKIENDSPANQIKQDLAQMVNVCSLNVSDDSNERYSIIGSLFLITEISGDGRIVQSYYTLDCCLSDNALEEKLLPIKIEGRERSTSESEAKRRAYQALSSKIKSVTTASFLNFLNSL